MSGDISVTEWPTALCSVAGATTIVVAETLVEFRAGLATVDESAIYLHTVETRARERRSEAFSEWLRDSLELPALAERFERIDPYLTTLERVRGRLLGLVDTALDEARR